MKRMQSILIATLTGCALSVSSCSNEDETLQTSNDKKAPLEIDVNISQTRSIIYGTNLPEECDFGIFAIKGNGNEALTYGYNNRVTYVDGNCTLNNKIYLTEDIDVPIYAYYPYREECNLHSIPIETASQTDYLYGYSANSDNQLTYVKASNPKAKILFKHGLSRITFNIKKAENNTKEYNLSSVGVSGVPTHAYLNVMDGGSILDPSEESDIAIESNITISQTNSSVDLLAIPMNMDEKTVTLKLSFGNQDEAIVTIPQTNWQSGQQYTYNVIIENKQLSISPAEITSWNTNTPENGNINIGDENYAASIGDIFYSDGTFSPNEISNKTPIGIVFALTDTKGGEINRSLRNSQHGRIIALKDLSKEYSWLAESSEYTDTKIPNYITENAVNTEINNYGMITLWEIYVENDGWGDFNGISNTEIINNENFPAAYACSTYETVGTDYGNSNWYLPSAGELKLIQLLCTKKVIYPPKLTSFTSMTYTYWSSTEANSESAVCIQMNENAYEFIYDKKKSGEIVRPILVRPASTF